MNISKSKKPMFFLTDVSTSFPFGVPSYLVLYHIRGKFYTKAISSVRFYESTSPFGGIHS